MHLVYIYFMKYILLIIIIPFVSCAQKMNERRLLQDLQYLSSDSLKGRKTGTVENLIAANYIANRFRKIGLTAYKGGYLQEFTFKNRSGQYVKGTNVIACLPGRKEAAIVISAHFDHVGVINGRIFNGADDNASGVSGLMALAAYFVKKKPNHTLVFAAFDGEEIGLQGSKAFVNNPPLPLDKIKLNLNMDMISHNDKGELFVAGTFKSHGLKQFLPSGYRSTKLLTGHDDPKLGVNDWTDQSDQGSFNEKGIPFLYFGVEDHKDYHKETDEYKNINEEFFKDAVEVIRQVLENLDANL